jgi:hypothetical protein
MWHSKSKTSLCSSFGSPLYRSNLKPSRHIWLHKVRFFCLTLWSPPYHSFYFLKVFWPCTTNMERILHNVCDTNYILWYNKEFVCTNMFTQTFYSVTTTLVYLFLFRKTLLYHNRLCQMCLCQKASWVIQLECVRGHCFVLYTRGLCFTWTWMSGSSTSHHRSHATLLHRGKWHNFPRHQQHYCKMKNIGKVWELVWMDGERELFLIMLMSVSMFQHNSTESLCFIVHCR